MILLRRREGSQRPMKPLSVSTSHLRVEAQSDGCLTFKTTEGVYYIFYVETEEELKTLLSAVHLLDQGMEQRKVHARASLPPQG